MKQVKTDRLLHFHRVALRSGFPDIFNPDVAAAPEIVHILLLGCKEFWKPFGHHAIQGPLSPAAEFFGRSRWRRMIDHVFGELDGAVWLSFDCESDLAEILVLRNLVRISASGFHHVVGGASQGEAALLCGMTQHDPAVFRITSPVVKGPALKDSRLSRITASGECAWSFHRHLGRNDNVRRSVKERDPIGNGGDVFVGERYKAARGDKHLLSCRCFPNDFPVERTRFQVEPPVVFQ